MENDEPKYAQKESVKLSRNSKGYTWEIKTISLFDSFTKADFERLKVVETWLNDEYGSAE